MDKVVVEIGPDKAVQDKGSLVCTLHSFRLYGSPADASIDQGKISMADAQYYADRSKFLLMEADIQNIDYKDYDGKEDINLSMFTIAPKVREEPEAWDGSLPVYLSDPGEGDSYYHFPVKAGETKTVAIGFYVPVKDAGELCSGCWIAISGCTDEGYVYGIPKVW